MLEEEKQKVMSALRNMGEDRASEMMDNARVIHHIKKNKHMIKQAVETIDMDTLYIDTAIHNCEFPVSKSVLEQTKKLLLSLRDELKQSR